MGIRGKKFTALLGAVVMTASLFSGCGSASESNGTTADTQTAQENTADTENQENTGDTVTISMWGWDEGTITNVAKEFNKEYPNILSRMRYLYGNRARFIMSKSEMGGVLIHIEIPK